jgi:hypothetical protein
MQNRCSVQSAEVFGVYLFCISRYSHCLVSIHSKLLTYLFYFWYQLWLLFSPFVGKKDIAVSLSENIPTKTKTQSECLEDELDLDLELDIGNVVSINTKDVKVCLVTNFEVLSFIILLCSEFKLLYRKKTHYLMNVFIACCNDNVYTKHPHKGDKMLCLLLENF